MIVNCQLLIIEKQGRIGLKIYVRFAKLGPHCSPETFAWRLRRSPEIGTWRNAPRRGRSRRAARVRTRTIPEQIADHVAVAIIKGGVPRRRASARAEDRVAVRRQSRPRARSHPRAVEARPGRVPAAPRRLRDRRDAGCHRRHLQHPRRAAGLAAPASQSLPKSQRPEAEAEGARQRMCGPGGDANVDPEFCAGAWADRPHHLPTCGNAHLARFCGGSGRLAMGPFVARAYPRLPHGEAQNVAAADWIHAGRSDHVAGDGGRAAALTRKALFDSRDAAIETLQQLRGETVSTSRFVRE